MKQAIYNFGLTTKHPRSCSVKLPHGNQTWTLSPTILQTKSNQRFLYLTEFQYILNHDKKPDWNFNFQYILNYEQEAMK